MTAMTAIVDCYRVGALPNSWVPRARLESQGILRAFTAYPKDPNSPM